MDIINELSKYKNINFTEQQKEVVLHTNGPALVLAVPGGGKTTTLMGRTANLICQKLAKPDEILSVTFSKASAEDMTKRYDTLFDFTNFPPAKFSTIHSFGYKVIKSYSNLVGEKYKIIEGNDVEAVNKNKLIRSIYRKITKSYLDENQMDNVISSFSYIKNVMAKTDQIEAISTQLAREIEVYNFAQLQKQYEDEKQENYYLDYDDLLTFAYEILSDNPHLLKQYQQQYKYIQVDEGQDTSLIQHKIINLLAKDHQNIFYVADDDQSIYKFRGSTPEYLLKLHEHYRNPKIYKMERNFRSTQKIVNLANEFIKTNELRYNKNIFTENEEGTPVKINFRNGVDEIINIIQEENKLSDIAILFRESISALNIIPDLLKKDIPFYIKDSEKLFLTHWAIKDLFAISEFAADDKKIVLFAKFYYKLSGYYISKEMIETIKKDASSLTTYEKLKKAAKNELVKNNIVRLEKQMRLLARMQPQKAIEYIINVLGYKEYLLRNAPAKTKLEDIKAYQFIMALENLCHGVETFSELYDYMEDLKYAIKHSVENKNKDAVILSTLHSSKGLEWKTVFLIDVEDGIFPNNRKLKLMNPEDIEEERRLCYVGITRAKKQLEIYGKRSSIFIQEIHNILEPKKKVRSEAKTAHESQLSINDLTEGLVIRHTKYGEGYIEQYDESQIHVVFFNGPSRKLSTSFCLNNGIICLAE